MDIKQKSMVEVSKLHLQANADILTLLLKKEVDGAWVPEPWGERFIKEANSHLFKDERGLWPDGKFVTANIVVRSDYLKENPDVIEKLLGAHINETQWINTHKDEALVKFNSELKKINDSDNTSRCS